MHVVSQGSGGRQFSGANKPSFGQMKSSSSIKASGGSSTTGTSGSSGGAGAAAKASTKKKGASAIPDLLRSGKIEKDPSGKRTVYRVGKQKFTLDGRDGKTLDDIIEVRNARVLFFGGFGTTFSRVASIRGRPTGWSNARGEPTVRKAELTYLSDSSSE